MSNAGGANVDAKSGKRYYGGGGGGGGVGGVVRTTRRGQNGANGHAGIGGYGGGSSGHTLWANSTTLATALGSNGGGADGPCMTYQYDAFCISGSGGGGWGGGASGSNGHSGQYNPAGGGGGGSFAAPSTATDSSAPTTAPTNPFGQAGGVRVIMAVQSLPYQSAFCSETTLAGTEGFRCIVPFDWTFTAPSEYLQPGWLATIQAVGGPGGNGGPGGEAQTTLNASDLAGETLYAFVGAAGAESTTNGGGRRRRDRARDVAVGVDRRLVGSVSARTCCSSRVAAEAATRSARARAAARRPARAASRSRRPRRPRRATAATAAVGQRGRARRSRAGGRGAPAARAQARARAG